ncbi:MAG: tetratricopeptide repeat protein [Ignavibacteriaceae bacterium]
MNSDIGRYCLTKIQICYDSLGQTDFDLYADKFVAGSLKNSDLGAARIELTNKKLLENRNYDQALKNMEAASANTNYSEEVRKINLYNIAMLYFNISNDVDKAKEVFAQFKEQYPNDRLNDDAEILLGSIFSAKLNKEAVSSEIVSETKLFDNYPNPFNPITTINYSVKEAGLVKIKVYDILGREIEMLVNEVRI